MCIRITWRTFESFLGGFVKQILCLNIFIPQQMLFIKMIILNLTPEEENNKKTVQL